MTDTRAALLLLATQLDARPVDPSTARMSADQPRCPGAFDQIICGVTTSRIRGHVCLCLKCSETEIGMTVAELREQVTNRMTKGQKRKWSMHSAGARERGVLADQRAARQ